MATIHAVKTRVVDGLIQSNSDAVLPLLLKANAVFLFWYRAITNENGTDTAARVNQSPGFEASLIPVNGKSPALLQFFAVSVITYVSACTVAQHLVLLVLT